MPNDWWTPVAFAVGQARRFRIGPATVIAERRPHEWRVRFGSSDDPIDATLEVGVVIDARAAGESVSASEAHRFAFRAPPPKLALEPRLADRAVIVRPADPLTVPAGESVLLFVSTPLWAQVVTAGPRHLLLEAPCYRPSDTWFGPSTREGELAYASRTTARLELNELPARPHRAITPVRVANRSDEPLQVDRLRVPVEHLPLFGGPRGLWTSAVRLEHGGEHDGRATIRVDYDPPSEAGRTTRLSEPRRTAESGLTLRTFGRWLGLAGGGAP